ncbi:hypothetical protein [Arthrobacter sp. MYb213]|uniref:DUF6932 family protein n=1 Tax=Arthrobacter sp. MYb213 TaxID=1848595 RepID=UPI000CFBAD4D|nr:hypothetical protein [Arthrobacter sp. MYb213]PRB69487.1 hypothetical protein CQ011_12045 [Arthrobacter sp. MYb213]
MSFGLTSESLRDLLNDYDELPADDSPYTSTLDQLEKAFVLDAPFEEKRRLIFKALALYCELLWLSFPHAKLWVNGGFTTHKRWGAPDDVDVLVVIPNEDLEFLSTKSIAPFLTLENASAPGLEKRVDVVRPFGGYVDGYFAIESNSYSINQWHNQWSQVKMPDGSIHPIRKKGFVEVVKR